MTDSSGQEPAFRDLVNAVCCEVLTPSQAVVLEQQLLASEQARKEYFQACELTVEIWIALGASRAARQAIDRCNPAASIAAEASRPAAAEASGSPALGFLRSAVRSLPGGEFTVGMLVMMAIVAAFYTLQAYWRRIANEERGRAVSVAQYADSKAAKEPDSTVGYVSAPSGTATIDHARTTNLSGAPMPLSANGHLSVHTGVAELRLRNGVALTVEGPAELEPKSDGNIQLHSGQLVALVPHRSRGFTVQTPIATIIDLGTEFGVRVVGDRSDIQVFQGEVSVVPGQQGQPSFDVTRAVQMRAGELVRVDSAGRVQRISRSAQAIAKSEKPVAKFIRPQQPARSVQFIDLADVVAGGDGFGAERGGINPLTGEMFRVHPDVNTIVSDGKYHCVADSRLIDGVFIPETSTGPVQLDSAGHTFGGFDPTDGNSWNFVWSGGALPFAWWPSATVLDRDYSADGHSLILLHANKGITFNLVELAAGIKGCRLTEFTARAGNPSHPAGSNNVTYSADLWVFVDGELRSSKRKFYMGNFDLKVALRPDDRLLTIVCTDGGDGYTADRVILGDPRIALRRAGANGKEIVPPSGRPAEK